MSNIINFPVEESSDKFSYFTDESVMGISIDDGAFQIYSDKENAAIVFGDTDINMTRKELAQFLNAAAIMVDSEGVFADGKYPSIDYE